jgi:hypothetical protein
MSETPIDLDKHRMATQKATDIRRVVAEVEANAKLLRENREWSSFSFLPFRPRRGPMSGQRHGTS